MTSTYPLPFLLFLTVPPFRTAGAPIRSSMELALLVDVVGREGGPGDGPPRPPPGMRLAKLGGMSMLWLSPGESVLCGVPVAEVGPEGGRGVTEGIEEDMGADAFDIEVGIGGLAPARSGFRGAGGLLTARNGGPLGGGGVALGVEAAAPPFLLIHFLSSGS